MASFPDLRPGFRSAKAGGKAVRRFRSPVLLAVSAALLLTAFLAVSELATLRGAKAHDASAFLTRELGPPLDSAPLVRTPARDLKVSLSARGFAVRRGSQALGVTLKGKGAAEATGFARGASTRTSFGRAVVTVSPKKTEQYLVVDSHQGKRTWQWQLETDGLTPRVGDDGFVGLIAGHRLTETFVIAPPEILDSEGRNISPRGLHWDLTGRKGNWSLELTLDDNGMPTPYIIDPASYNVGAGTTGPTAAAGSIALNVPAGVKLGDLLIAHVAWGAGSTTTTSQPGGWTQILTTQNSGTNLGTSLWYKNASAADTSGGTYTWTFSPNDVATGGIAAYTGIDNSAPLQVTPTTLTQPATNDTGVYYPSITPTVNGDQIVSVLAWNRASSGTDLTAPAGINGTNTERWETANSGGIASELSDYTQGTAATVNTNGSNSANRKNVVHITFRVALKADTTAPNSAFALTSVSPAGSAYYPGSGTTVWYRGTDPSCAAEVQVAGRCSFKIQNTVTDAGSGPASSQFNALGGTTTGWLFTSGTVTMPAGGPYVSNFYSWASGTSSAPTENIVGADNGGNTDGGTTLTLMNDVTGPTVPAPTVTAGYYTSLSVPVSLGSVTDPGGSGPNASSYVVQRDEATLSNNVCGAFSDSWSTVTLSGGNDTTVVTGKCYRYREQAADNVRNSTNSSASNTAMVDTTAPSTPTLSFSNLSANAYWDTSSTVYFRPSAGGAFTVTALSNDAQSLIASYTFDTLNSNAGSNWGGSQTSDHFDYTFGASTTAPSTARTIHSTNNAGTNSADATYTIAADTTGPSVTAPSVTAGYYTSVSVPVGENGGTDGGSGVAPGSSMVQRDEATLSAGGCGSFSGSWTTVTLSAGNDTGVANGKCYEYREQLTDNVGNVGTSSASAIAKVDSAGPSNSFTLTSVSPAGSAFKNGTTIYYRGVESGGGSFKIRNALSDPESGAASSETAALGGTATGWTHTGSTVSTPAGGPFDSNDFTWAQGTMTSPTEVVTGRDGAGNATASATLTFTDDSSAPAGGALTVNGTAASGGGSTSYDSDGDFTIGTRTDYSETQSATESGLANSTLVRTSATYSSANVCGAFGSPTTISGNPDQTSLTTGCYRYTLTGTDNVGNTLSIQTTVKVDTSAPDSPSLSFSNVAGGAYYSGSGSQLFFRPTASSGGFDITAGSSDGDTDISGYTFPSAGSMGTNWSGSGSGASRTYSFTPTAGEPGTQNVSATNNAGGTSSSSFTVTADSAAATTTIQCNGAACLTGTYYTSSPVTVTLSGNDGTGSGVQKIRYTTDGTDPTPVNGSDYAGALSINSTTTVKFRAYDNLGNEEAVGSQEILLDGTPPNVSLTLAENPASGTQHVSGTTLFYRPGAAGGTFRVTAAADDPQTGVTSVDFPAISNVTGGGSQTSSPYREDYTWSASTTDAASHDVVATNGAGATTNVPFTLAADSAVPTGESITLTGADVPYYGSASVSFSLGDGNDGSGSGLDVSSRTVTRETGDLAGDSCSSFSADPGSFSSPDTSVTGGHCYRYTFTIADNVGNVSAPVSATAKVDTQAPTVSVDAPSELSGNGNQYYDAGSKTLFFRSTGAGSFRLNASAGDTDTAVSAVSFPDLSALSGWAGSSGGSDPSSPYSSPVDYSWNAGAAEPAARTITATDKASNPGSDTITISNDTSAPTGQTLTLTGATAPYFNTTAVTFGLTDGSDGTGSGIDTSTRTVTRETGDLAAGSCSNFSADPGTFTSPDTSVTSGHCYRYTFTIADNVGNVSSTVTATAKVDTGDPSVSLDDPGTPLAGGVSLSATASDGETNIQLVTFERAPAGTSSWTTVGTDATAPYTANWDTTLDSDGLYDLRAVATDTVDNSSSSAVANRRVDNAAPDTSIDSTPADPSNDGTPTFTFSSSEPGSTFECRVDSGSWSSCTSPHTRSPALTEGSHTFDVRATDQAGNTDGSPASHTWTIDLTAPDTTIDANPSNPSGNATPSFSFSSSEPSSSFQCRIDSGSWASCTSPHTISPALTEGSHTFGVRATDSAGNTDGSPASHTWAVDLTAPDTTIDANPSSPSGNATPNFSFSSSEPSSSFECRVDSGSWASCTSPHTISPALTEGSHTFDVRATDQAGNTDGSPASHTWTVDLTAPNTTIDASPSSPSGNAIPSFNFSSEPGAGFECRIDSGSWASCTSPHTISPALTEGSHTFDVRATDQAGNADQTPASHTWTVDLTAPDTTIDANPSSPSGNATPSFSFSSSEPSSSFQCRVDSGSWVSCTSPHTISPALTEGSHTFDVHATDQAGNTDATPASHTWTVDLGSPSVTITAPTTYVSSSDPNNYTVTASTPDSDVDRVDFYECSNGSAACATGSWLQFGTDNTAPYSATWSTPAFDGPKAIRAVAVDLASNTGQHVRTITIDRTAPSGVSVSYPNVYVFGSFAITTNNGPDSDVNASSGVLERRTGDLLNDSCSSYDGWAVATSPDTLASGKCAQYRYRLADNAGNWTIATSSNEAKSDTAAPTSSQDDPGTNLRQTIALSTSAGDTGGSGVASVAFQRRPSSGGSWTTIDTDSSSPYSTSFDTTGVSDGLYDFRSVATDVGGNVEGSALIVSNRRIDNTAPSATMLSPGNPVRDSVTLTSNTTDGGSGIAAVGYELAPSGGSFNSQPSTWDTTLSADGLYDLRVTATDVAGNSTTSSTITTRVDNTAPALTFSSPTSGEVVSGTVSLVASASDASPASPPVSFAYKLHSDPPSAYTSTGASWNTTALPAGDGLYDLRARATDDAANSTTLENTSILVDNVPPSVSITAPATAINGSLPSPTSFTATASDPSGSGVSQVQFFECSNQSTDCSSGVWSPLGTVAAPGPYSVSWTIPGTDGNHALAAVATDNAGHPSSAIRNVDVDRTAPNTTIVGKPADPSNGATPTFTFSSSETGSTFECRIDGGSFAPCTSPHNVSGLTDNLHTFEVRATDPAGNTDATPDTWTWHRDTNDPAGSLNNPGANIRQSVTLTSSESDPPADGYASGLSSVAYEYSANGTTWAPIGTLNSAPFDSLIWNTTGVADGVYQLHVVVSDVAGNTTTSTAVPNVRIDNTPPTTSQNDPGQYLRATKTLTASAADSGGSGIDHVDFQWAPTGGGSWTTIATDSTPGDGLQASFDTTGVSDGHYDLRTVAYDVAGNQAASTPVADRLVDNTPPDATMNNPGAYLRGSVNLTSSTSDPGGANASGVVSVAYEYSTTGGATWQSTGASFDSTSVADGNVELHVIATDAAGNTTTSSPVTSLADNTKPATTDNAPSGWQSSAATVTLTANDAGSGVNVTEYSVDGNPSYTVGTSVVIPAPADGSNDGAHTIAYFSVDNAGNIETVKSATVLIDATPPVCPSCAAADYLRGTVTLNASPDPDGSGIQSVAFEYTDAGGSTWTLIGTDTTGPAPYSASWDTISVPDGHYDLRIRITDNADNVTTANLPDKVVDNTAPDVATVGAPTEGQLVTGTIAVTASASDATSPVASVQFLVRGSVLGTDTTAPFSLDWNSATGADGTATIQVVVTDMAGNSTTSAVRNVSVDNVSPTPTLADPGQYLNGTVSLSATSDPDTTEVDFERRPAGGGSWATIASDTTLPWDTSLDTTTLADGLYDFRAVATDQTSQTGSSIRSNVRVDNTAPSGSLTTPASGATVGGPSVSLGVSVSDAGSGVASVRYELRPTGGGSFTQIASSSTAPFGATWDATTVATGSYDLRPVITDRAGNEFTGGTVTVDVDVTAPTIAFTNPGATISGAVTLNATVSGSGATQVVFGATPAGGATWTYINHDTSAPWSVPFDTTKLADGVYDLRATVSDGLGNTSIDVVASIRIDNTAPRVISSTPAEGSTVTSASSISLVTSEAATPVGVTLDGGSTVAPVVSGTSIAYGTGPLGAGPHTLAGELQDSAGKKTPFRLHFTVWPSSGSTAPYVEKNTSSSSSTTLDSADGFAAVTMPAGAWSTSSSDWIVLRVAPAAAPSGLTNGFGPGPEALDVTAWWALAGTQLHQFSQPVSILLRSTEKGLVPATFESGNWRVIHRVPTAGTLPAGWDDGFFTDAAGFHVLTKHLSLFALLRDLEPPRAPQDIRGFAGPGGLTIRWLPGADNSGTYDYVTVFADSTDAGHYGPDYTATTIGGWKAGDSRVFRLKETDLAGNASELSQPLLPVPSLAGMTPDQADVALKARGFTLGNLTVGGSGKAGTITGPEGLVLAEQGSAIDLTVAPGGASTSLVFKVITAPKFKPAATKKIAARVSVTRAARVTAEFYSPRRVKLFTWRFSVKAGRSIVRLRIPRQVRRSGVYSMRWTARAGRETVARTIKIRVIGTGRAPVVKPAPRVAVVLAGPATRDLAGTKRNPRFVAASGVEPTFDAAASRHRDVRVIVVDVDSLGLALIRDLHTVFPSVKIVALASGPRTMAAALRAGAAIVLPRSTPPATLAKVIQKLLAKPSNRS